MNEPTKDKKIEPQRTQRSQSLRDFLSALSTVRSFSLLIACAVILLAFALRFHLLGAQSLWHDEGNSYVQATRSFADIALNAGRDIHPPGYYWLLAIARAVWGESEFALRALSAFASVITVALV